MIRIGIAFLVTVALMSSAASLADTLELANGQVHEGRFVGSSNGIIMFDTGAGIEAFPEDQVVGVFFSSGVETAEVALAVVQPPATTAPPALW